MSSFPCRTLSLEGQTDLPYLYVGGFAEECVRSQLEWNVNEPLTLLERILKYQPKEFKAFHFTSYDHPSVALQRNIILESIPRWWLKPIKKMTLCISKCLPVLFIRRLPSLDFLNIRFDNEELFLEFLKISPQVLHLSIWCDDCVMNDSILEAVLQKSFISRTEFPFWAGKHANISLTQVIRFMELNNFPTAYAHPVSVQAHVKGREEDWLEWLRLNTSPPSNMRLLPGHWLAPFRYDIIYREMYFVVKFAGFIDR